MNQTSASRRTFQEVHRDSKLAGTVEAALWKPSDLSEQARAIKAARLYELHHKKKGRRNGPLGHVGLEVLEALWSVVDFTSGRLEPSLVWLMEKTGRCRAAVVEALKRLDFCGFVKWTRRFVFDGAMRGVRGPQVKQITNAYALETPADAAALVPDPRPRTGVRGADPQAIRLELARMGFRKAVAHLASTRPYREGHYRNEVNYLASQCSAKPINPSNNRLKRLHLLLAECESATPDQSR